MRDKAVLCLSGGMDSCVCAALATRDYEVYALHFGYGQRTEARELRAAQDVARLTGAKEFMHLKIDLFRRIGGSALTDASIAVPDAHEIGKEIPGDVCAVSQCTLSLRRGQLGGGSGREDYPDRGGRAGQLGLSGLPAQHTTTPSTNLIRTGTKEGDIRVETPLIRTAEERDRAKLGVEVGRTVPCKLVMLFRRRRVACWNLRELRAAAACIPKRPERHGSDSLRRRYGSRIG